MTTTTTNNNNNSSDNHYDFACGVASRAQVFKRDAIRHDTATACFRPSPALSFSVTVFKSDPWKVSMTTES
eukprot:1081930-Amphidinium_carterae.1